MTDSEIKKLLDEVEQHIERDEDNAALSKLEQWPTICLGLTDEQKEQWKPYVMGLIVSLGRTDNEYVWERCGSLMDYFD